MILSVFVLSSCSDSRDIQKIGDEWDRISSLLPDELTEDFQLPVASDSFEVTYNIKGDAIPNNTLIFEAALTNSIIELTTTIVYKEQSAEYVVTIIQIGNESVFYQAQVNYFFTDIFSQIGAALQNRITSNVTLPMPSEDDATITYTSSCSTIKRGRLEFLFVETDTNCQLNAQVSYRGNTRNQSYAYVVSSIDNLPRIPELYITTNGGAEITSKNEYVTGSLNLTVDSDSPYESLNNAALSIRLRGNSTSVMPKPSFKIKFDEKQFLLSDYEEKDWVLLANFADQTLVRNYLAFQLSDDIGMDFAPKYTFVDVYLNGEYLGNYMLSDQIEVTNDRVDIEENEIDIDTGYLIEYDVGLFRDEVDENYFTVSGIPFVIKSPDIDDDHYQSGHKTFIRDYVTLVLNTLKSKNDYSELIDEASFIDWFIVNELFKNVDSGYSSVYFYKDKGSKLKMGPVWDFDLSTGNPGHLDDRLRAPEGWYTSRSDKNVFFYYLMQYPDFQQALKERWNELYDTTLTGLLDEVFIAVDSITYSRYMNFEKWDIIGINYEWYTATEVYALKTYDEQVWFLYDYLDVRMKWLDNAINAFN